MKTASTAFSRKGLRIALLLREAGVLDEAHWQAYINAVVPKTETGIWDILNRPITLRSFRNVLLTDVKDFLPGRSRQDLSLSICQPVLIRPSEIAALLRAHQTDVVPICHLLISKGLLTEETLREHLEEADRNELDVHEVLVASHIITPEAVNRLTEDGSTRIARDNRLLIAGEILIYNNLVTKDVFSSLLRNQEENQVPIWKQLQEQRLLSQSELFQSLEDMDLPQVELIAYPVSMDLLEKFPTDFMRRQAFVPLSLQDNHLELASNDPFNLALADTITLLTGHRVSLLHSKHEDLLAKLQALFPPAEARSAAMPPSFAPARGVARRPVTQRPPAPAPEDDHAGQNGSGEAAMRVSEIQTPQLDFEPYVDNLDAVQLISRIIEDAISTKATDIHLEPAPDALRVRYRVDGELHQVMSVPAEMSPYIAARVKVLAQMNVTERRRPQDGHFSLDTQDGGFYDFRVSTLPSIHGEKLVLRVLDSTRVLTGLSQLGLDEHQMETVERLIRRPHGLVLSTGPTGSGKTSTLYSCLSGVNREEVNIITIEDPVEYQLEGITQVQVDPSVDVSFATGLRGALRQDPDVIMVGEIRDPDTARTAIRASLTGHLVFSTLHTNSAMGAVTTLRHMDIQQFLVASALTGIIGQRLVRTVCQNCRKQVAPTKGILRELGLPETCRKKLSRGTGCDACFGTGYSGRTGIFQVVEIGEELRRAISEGKPEVELNALAELTGPTLLSSGAAKVLAGITTPDEVLKAVSMHG